MRSQSGSTSDDLTTNGWIESDAVLTLARELGLKERRVEEWRSWGLVPSPRRAPNVGKRPRWIHPPHTLDQLRAAAAYMPTRGTAPGTKVALWVDGFPYDAAAIRSAIGDVISDWQSAQLKNVLRHAPPGTTEETLATNEAVLSLAIDGLADEWARRRSATSPFPRTVRLTLPERTRAMRYLIRSNLGIERDEADAVLAERVAGLSRGRSAAARGITWQPETSVPGVTPTLLAGVVERADDLALALARNSLQLMRTVLPDFAHAVLPPMTPLGSYIDSAADQLKKAPIGMWAVIAAHLLRGTEESRKTDELTPEIVAALAPENVRKAIAELGR